MPFFLLWWYWRMNIQWILGVWSYFVWVNVWCIFDYPYVTRRINSIEIFTGDLPKIIKCSKLATFFHENRVRIRADIVPFLINKAVQNHFYQNYCLKVTFINNIWTDLPFLLSFLICLPYPSSISFKETFLSGEICPSWSVLSFSKIQTMI